MAFGLNQVQLIGRLGRDVEIRHTRSGGKVANLNVATDESYVDRNTGQKIDKAEWHRVVSFQDGVVDMLEKHARKGRLVYVQGKLQTTKWQDQNGNDRYTTEIIIVPGGRVEFMDKPDDRPAPSQPAPAAAPTPAPANDPYDLGPGLDHDIPF